ncbi:dynamin family protein [Sphaerimonospora cavernae]|uniref:Dynamin family protein n=1 Tax=Sphaerimonospora cavernae TaxID=1740611 RepID=A0ABV6U4K2_9ACTN
MTGTGEVRRLLGEVADAAEEFGREEAARAVRAEQARLGAGAATVVVVGEKKRGKSSLINAIVERPGLLPVDADVATNVHLTVRHAGEPVARVFDGPEESGRSISIDDIAEYGALDPLTQAPRHPGVRHVEAGLPSALLAEGLILIDTPGVGGLVAGHTALTLAVIDRADALLFVVNGSGEFTESELQFLAQITDRTATVVFALAQIDKYAEWQKVLDRNRELLARHAPRFAGAPWHPVSALRYEEAAEAEADGRPDIAADRRASSGVRNLLDGLRERVIARAEAVRNGNALQVAATTVGDIHAAQLTLLESLRGDPELARAVAERRDRLKRVQSADASWRSRLQTKMADLERELHHRQGRLRNDLTTEANNKIATGTPEELRAFPREIEAAVEAMWLDLDNRLRKGVSAIAAETAAAVDAEVAQVSERNPLPDRLRLPATGIPEAEDPMQGGTAERMLTTIGPGLMTFGILGNIVAPGVAALAGVGATVYLQRARKKREEAAAGRRNAALHLQMVLREIQTEVPAAIQGALRDLRRRIEEGISAQLADRVRAAQEVLAEYERMAAAAEEEVASKRALVQSGVDELAGLRDRCAALAAGPASA